jgi:hypothetical protein
VSGFRRLPSRAAQTGLNPPVSGKRGVFSGKSKKGLRWRYVLDMFMVPRLVLANRGTAKPHQPEVSHMAEKIPILVVLGLDIENKPHASRFAEHDAPFVKRASELMGLHVIRVGPENEELHGLAEGLPLGKIFATGRAFVPFVARSTFNKLATLVEGGVTIEQRAASGAAPVYPLADMFTTEAVNAADVLWAKVEAGTVVLATQPDLYGPGWWKCCVVAIDGDDLTLRWMDDPSLQPFHQSRREVALRHPGD